MNKRKLAKRISTILDQAMGSPLFKTIISNADTDYMRKRALEAISVGSIELGISLLVAAEEIDNGLEATHQK